MPGGVRVTKIVPGGYIDTQIKAGKLKFEVGEIVHSVAARDVTSAKDVSRNILSTRREGHSGFFIGTASPTGLGRFSVEFSELLTDPKTGEVQLPPLQFHIVAANAVKDPVDESCHAWFPIGGDFMLKRYDNAHTNWDHLKFPIEKMVGDKRLGLVGDSDATSIPWDGSWHIEKCELSADPNNQNAFRVDVTVDSHASELLRKLTSTHQGERLAVVVEERIVLAPTIGSVIEKSFSITGTFTKVEAEQLVQAIRRGIKLEPEGKLPNTAVPFIEVPKVQNTVPERKLPPVDGAPVHPKLADDTAWGKEIGGLQAGLGFEYGNRRTYGHGQGITLVVRLRNVGKEAVKFEYLRQFLDENPPTVTNADNKTIPQNKTTVMGQHVPVSVTLEPDKEMVLETPLHGSKGIPYVLIPPNSKEKRDDKVTPLVVAAGNVQLQIEKVFGNSSSGFLKFDPALEKLSTGKLELEVIR